MILKQHQSTLLKLLPPYRQSSDPTAYLHARRMSGLRERSGSVSSPASTSSSSGSSSASSPCGSPPGGTLQPSGVREEAHSQYIDQFSRGDLMASKTLTFFDKTNLNWGGLKKWQKLSYVICSFTQQGHFVMSSCPQMKPENVISSPPRVEKGYFSYSDF